MSTPRPKLSGRKAADALATVALGILMWWLWQRILRTYPKTGAALNGDAVWTYLPNAKAFLAAPWQFLSTNPHSYNVAPLAYIWPAAWGADPVLIQIANTALFLAGVLLIWDLVRRLGGHLAALVAVALIVAHPEIRALAPQVLTESPFFFGFALALNALLRFWSEAGVRKGWLLLFGVGLSITLLVRPVFQYMSAAAAVLLMLILLRHGHTVELRAKSRALLLTLLLCAVLPFATIVKNGMYFGVWGVGTGSGSGSGSGIYYGTSPFKNGAEPVFSNFYYDASIVPGTADPDYPSSAHPLDKRADAINRAVGLEIVRQTKLADNLGFFAIKLKSWLLTATPELFMNPKLRTLRVWEWLSIGLFLATLMVRTAQRTPLTLPGSAFSEKQKLRIYFGLMGATLAMVIQLLPVLYNTRYSSFFIEPWLVMLTGLSIGYWVNGALPNSGLRRWATMGARLLVLVALGWVAHQLTQHAQRREIWRLDPYRPGPTALVLPSSAFTVVQAEGFRANTDGSWTLVRQPALLHIEALTDPHTMGNDTMKDAMWRLRFALATPAGRPAPCARVPMAVEPHQTTVNWYDPPANVHVEPTDEARTYLLGANGYLRPSGSKTHITFTFDCPAGSRLAWHGMEMRRSTMPQAARDFIQHGIPINPYLHTEP